MFLDKFHFLYCVFPFFQFFQFSCHIPGPTSVHFSFSPFLSASCHSSGQRLFLSHFPRFFSFLVIFHVLECVFLIVHDFQFSHHNQGPTGCISHFPPFLCSSPYLTSKRAWFSFSMIFSFLTIIKVLQGAFLIFHLFSVPQHISHPTVCVSHFHNF